MENSAVPSVSEEIKQTKPFTSPSAEALVALLLTADRLRTRWARLLEPYDLSPQQYNVLRILRGADGRLPTLEIAARMIERSPGITRLVDRLEAKGLVRRERCAEDRRQVFCSITGAGLELLAELDEPMLRLDTEAVGVLSDAEIRQFISVLNRIRQATPG